MAEPPLDPAIYVPVTVKGEITFSCCDKVWTTAAGEVDRVRCPNCLNLFTLILSPVRSAVQATAPGTTIKITRSTTTQVGGEQRTLSVGEFYRVGHDPYGVLGEPLDETWIEVISPGLDGRRRVLLALVPNDAFEIEKEVILPPHRIELPEVPPDEVTVPPPIEASHTGPDFSDVLLPPQRRTPPS